MTVCVAAMAEDRKKLVVAADNMFTHGVGTGIQYQREDASHKKIVWLNDSVCVLTAGAHLVINPVVTEAKSQVKATTTPERAAEIVRQSLEKFYLEKIEQEVLKPNGIDWNIFRTKQKDLNESFFTQVFEAIKNFNLDVNLIVAGYNSQASTCYIAVVTGNGALIDHSTGGFTANGSGGEIARFSVLVSPYNDKMSVAEVEEIVKKSVVDAQKAPGVGSLGEIFTIPKTPPTNPTPAGSK